MIRSAAFANQPRSQALSASAAWIPTIFLIFVCLLGGGSRSDIASLPFLRAGAVMFAFWAALRMQREDWQRIRVPLLLMAALMLWMAIQLIPLPPSIWQSLPGRETIAAIDTLLGMRDISRPISLTPSLTLNSLLAMSVPIAALLVFAQMKAEDYPRLMLTLVAIACVSALVGLAQLFAGSSSGLYLYRITNTNSMVGFFANRNHHAVFLGCVAMIVAMMLRDEFMRKRKRTAFRAGLLFVGMLLIIMTILSGSRAGLVVGGVAFSLGYIMVGVAWRANLPRKSGAAPSSATLQLKPWSIYLPPLLMTALLCVVLWLSNRTTALSRFLEKDVADDLRVQTWPTVEYIVKTHWGLGSGFGSFSEVYEIFEPDNLLQSTYFNHAHNDWVEMVITGGLPFVVIAILAIAWLARSFASRGTSDLIKGYRGDVRLPLLVIILILAVASLVDYPLRVPSIQAMAVMFAILLCCPKTARA